MPILLDENIPWIKPSERAPTLDELLEDLDERLGSKLDRIIELLEQMVKPEEESGDGELACPRCGSDKSIEEFEAEDGSPRAICGEYGCGSASFPVGGR